jgi:hypothetical protein
MLILLSNIANYRTTRTMTNKWVKELLLYEVSPMQNILPMHYLSVTWHIDQYHVNKA